MTETTVRFVRLALLVGAVAFAGASRGQEAAGAGAVDPPASPSKVSVRPLGAFPIERSAGDLEASFVELTFPPGGSALPHRHSGFVLGYVVEGVLELALDDAPIREIRAGEAFVEPEGVLHRVGKGGASGAKVVAIIVAEPGSPTVLAP